MTVTVLRGRTSDRTPHGVRGAGLLGAALARRLGVPVAHVGEPGPPRKQRFEDDLRDGAESFAAAATAAATSAPVLLASQCSIVLATLPVVAAREPDAYVVWLDAHGDFNTPGNDGLWATSEACRWRPHAGAGRAVTAPAWTRNASCSATRATSIAPEAPRKLDRAGVRRVAPDAVAPAVQGERVFVHLDLDIVDPSILPGDVPAPDGLELDELRALLAGLAAAATIVGLENRPRSTRPSTISWSSRWRMRSRRCCPRLSIRTKRSRSLTPAAGSGSRLIVISTSVVV